MNEFSSSKNKNNASFRYFDLNLVYILFELNFRHN